MVNTLFKNKFVSSHLRFSVVQWLLGHQESAVLKTATGCNFHDCFILIIIFDMKHITEAAIVKCSPKVLPKVIHKLFNRKS